MKVKVINKSNNPLPEYQTSGSAGVDLYATLEALVYPGERKLVGTGIFLEIEEGYEAQVRTRSGLALKRGLVVLNSPGTIDSDYRGEVGVIIYNASAGPQVINAGERIAQLVFAKVEKAEFEEVKEVSETERGVGGFGSTGHL